MRSIKTILFIAVALCNTIISKSQNVNWANLNTNQKHILNVNVGMDYAFTFGLGYGYQLKTKLPVIVGLEHSQPSGEVILDDFKTKIGGQVKLYQAGNLLFAVKVYGVFRRNENELVRLINFGSDLSGVIGYYKSKWYLAAEVGFDKAIVTNFKHSSLYKEYFPTVKDGWYQPATGGNFYYGLQTGISLKITMYISRVAVLSLRISRQNRSFLIMRR
jgi:hypothetical protein